MHIGPSCMHMCGNHLCIIYPRRYPETNDMSYTWERTFLPLKQINISSTHFQFLWYKYYDLLE